MLCYEVWKFFMWSLVPEARAGSGRGGAGRGGAGRAVAAGGGGGCATEKQEPHSDVGKKGMSLKQFVYFNLLTFRVVYRVLKFREFRALGSSVGKMPAQ